MEGARDWPFLETIVTSLPRREQLEMWCVAADDAPSELKSLDGPIRVIEGCRGAPWRAILSRLEADLVLTTLTDLGTRQFPKGAATYAYVFHSLVSTHVAYPAEAFDNYDLIFAPGPVHKRELDARQRAAALIGRSVVEAGYPRLDRFSDEARAPRPSTGEPTVLIAPSWSLDDLYPTLWTKIAELMLNAGWRVVVRPHPETLKRSAAAVERLERHLRGQARFSMDRTAYAGAVWQDADIMISDWSGAAIEFGLARHGRVIFVDTPRKVRNPGWHEVSSSSVEDWAREHLGACVGLDQVSLVPELSARALGRADAASSTDWIAHPGSSGAVIARAIDERLFAGGPV
jgi:YidC/Oxa1 family membrane protein insertase